MIEKQLEERPKKTQLKGEKLHRNASYTPLSALHFFVSHAFGIKKHISLVLLHNEKVV